MPDLLESRAKAVLAEMIEQIRRRDESDPVFQFWTGEQCERQVMPPGTGQLMGSGSAKDEIFRFFRRHVNARGIDCCVFGSDTWCYRSTESAAKRHGVDELDRMTKSWPLEVLIDLGILEKNAALMVLAQNAADIVLLTQYYLTEPAFRLCGPPEMGRIPQADFRGRMKMYGDLRPENLCEHATSAYMNMG